MPYIVKLEILCGTTIAEAAQEAVSLSGRLGARVRFTFNGIDLEAWPRPIHAQTVVKTIVDAYLQRVHDRDFDKMEAEPDTERIPVFSINEFKAAIGPEFTREELASLTSRARYFAERTPNPMWARAYWSIADAVCVLDAFIARSEVPGRSE